MPKEALDRVPILRQLLAQRSYGSRQRLDRESAGVVALLDAQGCFMPEAVRELRLCDLLHRFQPIRSLFYSEYYGHPAWDIIRSGRASKAQLVAWVIHNYHISRSAGVIAARMASRTQAELLKRFFREDALEEFWHCDQFYFVDDPNLRFDPEAVKSYVPLPASTGFEETALRAADESWIGHLLIAYFQESSIVFGDDSEEFYDSVEANYGLNKFFAGWRRHMTLDLDHGHADGLKDLLDSGQPISVSEAELGLRSVQLAHYFLVRALDQIQAQEGSALQHLEGRQPDELVKRWNASPAAYEEHQVRHSPALAQYLLNAVGEAAFHCLAFSRTHDEIICAGKFAASLKELVVPGAMMVSGEMNPWLAAVRNFLLERASSFGAVLALTEDVLCVIARCDLARREVVRDIEIRRQKLALTVPALVAGSERARLMELLALAAEDRRIPPVELGLSLH
ncbi:MULTISPECIES: hypothetical protein [unclassified Bradyrhizobium]